MWVDFDNEGFIQAITEYRDLTSPDKEYGTGIYRSPISHSQELEWSEKYLFNVITPNTIQYYIEYETGPLFYENIPLVSESGELLIDTWDTYVLSASATPLQQALAWDFMMFVNDYNNMADIFFSGFQPTNRNMHQYEARAFGRSSIRDTIINLSNRGWATTLRLNESTQNAIALLESYGEMPMTRIYNIPDAMFQTIFDTLRLFHEGSVSAEQTAADLQNRVMELMLAERER